MNADLHALTGAYALDAVSPEERMEFERHLSVCAACRQEVAELRETATRLGDAAAQQPPPQLRSAVLARIRDVRQLPPAAEVVPLRRRRPLALKLSAAAAAVLLVVAGVFGVLFVRAQQETQDTRAQYSTMEQILAEPDATVRNKDSRDGLPMTAVWSLRQNRMLLLSNQFRPAEDGRDYQAWTIALDAAGNPTFHSAGIVPVQNTRAALVVNGIDHASQVGVTVEPKGGSAQPTTNPLVAFDLS